MRLKKILLPLLFLGTIAVPVAAQIQDKSPLYLLSYDYVRRWRFGFSIGLNVFDYSIVNTMKPVQPPDGTPLVLWADDVDALPGFNINGIVNYRLSRYFDLRSLPGICFGSRRINFYYTDPTDLRPVDSIRHTMPYESNYVEVPLLLKYSAKRTGNFRPYMVGGFNPRFNMNWKTREEKGTYIASAVFEPFYELGAGFDIYFYYFKLSFEFKYSGSFSSAFGSKTVEGYEYYRDVIDRVNSQIFIFAIHIE